MKFPRLKALFACFLGGISIIVLLNVISDKINHRLNGFIRLQVPHGAVPINHLNIKYNSFYIGGLVADTVYLFSYNSPWDFYKIPLSLNTNKQEKIDWGAGVKIMKGCKINVESPYVFLNDGISGRIFREDLNKFKNPRVILTPPFYAAVESAKDAAILKVTEKEIGNELIKFSADHSIKGNRTLLQKQGDGFFSTDGMLLKTPDKKQIFYVYYYRNQFMVADSNLTLLYRGRTIDTISRAQIKVERIGSQHATTMASPPLIVNKRAYATNQYLFINSSLYANNEEPEDVDRLSIIDVYHVKNGKYQCSFYLPDFDRQKISDFAVYGTTLVAIYGHFINTYKLNIK